MPIAGLRRNKVLKKQKWQKLKVFLKNEELKNIYEYSYKLDFDQINNGACTNNVINFTKYLNVLFSLQSSVEF